MVTVPAADSKVIERKAAIAKLDARRKAAGVTHDAIATKLKCTRPYVVNVFAGRRNATPEFVEAVESLCDRAERRTRPKAS